MNDLGFGPNQSGTTIVIKWFFTRLDMKYLPSYFSFIAILLGLSGCGSNAPQTSSSSAPNVIVIMTDDQGYGDFACHGNQQIKTPYLDQLYAQSIRLTNFHVGTTCSPTRAALMTGQNCNRVGVWHTIAGRSQLNLRYLTMADVFAHNGYKTGMFGKWHLGDSYPFAPEHRGFQEAFYHGAGGVGQMPDFWNNDYFDDTYFENGTPKPEKGYCTDVWFDATLSFIDQQRQTGQPFFAYLATNAPHGPYHVDSSYIRPYLNNKDIVNPNFYGMITQFDENLGVLMQKLEAWGIAENTLIVFLTDNGSSAGARLDKQGFVRRGYNAGLRGMKGSMYEGGHKVPCFIKWPGQDMVGGKDITQLTAHVDLLPTFIDLLALKLPESSSFDGISLKPLLTGNNSDSLWQRRVLITDTQRQEFPTKWRRSSTMQDNWRLINGKELYNVSTDPGQQHDIAAAHPEIVSELRAAYEAWWTDLAPSFNEYTRPIIGKESTITLYSHDWHEVRDSLGDPGRTPWHQTHIREGLATNGFWTVNISDAGTYQFDLCRWPIELNRGIGEGIPAKAAVPGGVPLPPGKALPLKVARLKVGEQEKSLEIMREDQVASFQLDLEAGPNQIQTWFEGKDIAPRGAYFVYIKPIKKSDIE